MKNIIIIITGCDNDGYVVDVKKYVSEMRSTEYQYACEGFESMIDTLVRNLDKLNKYEVTVKAKGG